MVQHYLKIAFRNLSKHKTFVFINVISLSFALCCCIIAYLNYDFRSRFNEIHTATDNVYRVNTLRQAEDGAQPWGIVPVALLNYLLNDADTSITIIRLASADHVVKANEKVLRERVHFADKDIFKVFNFSLQTGTFNVFSGASNVLISETMALKYFGNSSPIGETIELSTNSQSKGYTIAGIMKTMPNNSSFLFDIVVPIENWPDINDTQWNQNKNITLFIRTNTAESQIKGQLDKYAKMFNETSQEWKAQSFYLQPFEELGLTSDVDMPDFVKGSNLNPNPRGVVVIGPMIFSALVLLIAIFNFINTSVAFAGNRLKEIGVRKVFGTLRTTLVKQFMAENLLLCICALIVALFAAFTLLPVFNQTMQTELVFSITDNILIVPFLIIIVVVTASLSGFYPAFYVSAFKPIQILKGKATFTSGVLNKVLLVVQFAVCALSVITGIIMTQNASYQENSDRGYDINAIRVTMVENEKDFTLLFNAVQQHPKIIGIAGAAQQLGANDSYPVKAVVASNEMESQFLQVGSNYLSAMGIPFLEGRDFLSTHASDFTEAVIINETFARQFSIKNPLSETVVLEGKPYNIVGVVKDYKEFGNHGKIPAVVFKAVKKDEYKYMVVRSREEDSKEVKQLLQEEWKKVIPDKPYNGFAQVDMIEKEVRLSKGFSAVSFFMAILTMLLSAGGIYSLVSLNIIKRMKEVAMRKILGASVLEIATVLNKNFITLLLIAFCIGSGIAYLIISNIIFRFIYAYHSPVTIIPFVIALLAILSGVLAIIGAKVVKAATANPVDVLKVE